jgi:hypothetical protein
MSFLAFALAALAEPAAAQALPEDIVQISADLGLCAGAVVVELSPGPQTAEQVADAALARCERYFERMTQAGIRHYGRAWLSEMETARRHRRVRLVEEVTTHRRGGTSSDTSHAWGHCLGAQAAAVNAAPARDDAIERAFAACANEQEAARRTFAAQSSAQEADAMVEMLKRVARERVFAPGGPRPR